MNSFGSSTSVAMPALLPTVLGSPSRRRGLLAVSLVFAVVLGTLFGLTVDPHTPALGDAVTGDQQLAADVRAAMTSDRGYRTLSVGRVRAGVVTFAGLGEEHGKVPSPQTPYELGSITKTFTGMLLADAIRRKEMTEVDRLAQYLPELAGTPAGNVTLLELATHSSGLPSIPPDIASSVLAATLGNANPYQISVDRVIAATRTVKLKNKGTYAYSNLGMSLLGHAEARAAGAPDWPSLVTHRILQPLGMTATTFAATADDIPPGAMPTHHDNGWHAPHWYGPGFAPAGSGTWTTAQDLTRFAAAVLANKAPGVAALEPQAEASAGMRVGFAWHTIDFDNREITWHNGATGGMHTMLAFDRQRQQGVVVLGNTTRSVDVLGLGLAASNGPVKAVDSPIPDLRAIAATLAGLWFLIIFATAAVRAQDRLRLAARVLLGAAGLLLLLAHGPWVLVPAWVWGPLTGASVVLAGYAVPRWGVLPSWPGRRGEGDAQESPERYQWRRARRIVSAAVSLMILGFAIWSL